MQVNVNIWKPISPPRKKSLRICSLNSERREGHSQYSQYSFDGDTFLTSPRIINLKKKVNRESQRCNESSSVHSFKQQHHSVRTVETEKKAQNFTELDKLLQITSQCIQFYNKFTEEKDSELKTVKSAFSSIRQSLSAAFNGIIIEIRKKQTEIEEFLHKKQRELISIKDGQQTELNTHLYKIKSMHLLNLLGDSKLGEHSFDLNSELSNYANTLHKFYDAMETVDKCNFREGVDEAINFINYAIEKEIKLITDGKVCSGWQNSTFSFNDGLRVSFGSIANNPICSMTDSLEQSLQNCIFKNRNKQLSEAWTQTLNNSFALKKTEVSQVLSEVSRRQHLLKSKIDIYKNFKL